MIPLTAGKGFLKMTKNIESTDTVEHTLSEAELDTVTGGMINAPLPRPNLSGIVKDTAIIDGQMQGNYYNW
jgi:hypothetical protein